MEVFQKHDIGMDFLHFDRIIWATNAVGMDAGDWGGVQKLSPAELAAEASMFGIGKCRIENNGAMGMDELIRTPKREFVL